MTPLASVLQPVEDVLTSILEWLHGTVGISWAWSIIVLTILVRVVILPLTLQQIRSMQNMQLYLPELKALQEKYKNNKQKLQEEQMRFFREHKINPAASCLPILPQLPIFFSLFYVLRDFDDEVFPAWIARGETTGALSFLNDVVPNITDPVRDHWSGFVLLVIYVVSQWASFLLVPQTTMDPRQAKIMKGVFMIMPLVFIPVALGFPTGLMLYWVTTNLWTASQGVVTRRLIPRPTGPPPRRSSRTPPREAPAEPSPAGGSESNRSRPGGPRAGSTTPRPQASGQVRRRKKGGPRGR